MAVKPRPNVFTLRITLARHSPEIWRTVMVPGSARLDKVHLIFQATMGWTNSHLHQFRTASGLYGTHIDDYPEEELDEAEYTLADIAQPGQIFLYDYDFGDGWEHEIVISGTSLIQPGLRFAVCLDGASACPPEDCGGIGGYADLLEALADPAHEDRGRLQEWAGEGFDPAVFDLAAANAALQRIR